MYDVCNTPGGTAYRVLHDLPIIAAGKTGTSQITTIPQSVKGGIKEELLSYFHKSHAWITTYAPYKDPQFIVTVLVEHGGHGGSASAPIVKDIYNWLYEKGYFNNKPADEIVNNNVENNNTVALSPGNTSGTEENANNETVKKNKAIRKKVNAAGSVDLF
jgi:penicillin-binding protein 2